MASLIDSYMNTECEVAGKWVIARPADNSTFFKRFTDAFKVLTGRYVAVKFYATEYKKSEVFRKAELKKANDSNLCSTAIDLAMQDVEKQLVHDRESHLRNAPCPCGSGRKYKNCCNSPNPPNKVDLCLSDIVKKNQAFEIAMDRDKLRITTFTRQAMSDPSSPVSINYENHFFNKKEISNYFEQQIRKIK